MAVNSILFTNDRTRRRQIFDVQFLRSNGVLGSDLWRPRLSSGFLFRQSRSFQYSVGVAIGHALVERLFVFKVVEVGEEDTSALIHLIPVRQGAQSTPWKV